MTTGEKIRTLRQENKMTQAELANLLGVKEPAVYKYENGLVVNLKRSTIEKLSIIFHVDPAYLMGFEETAPNNEGGSENFNEKYRRLSLENRKKVDDFADFLLAQEENS